mmetsp:Transcript_22623/g.53414  ORF Transcript_22623/g.53414 Transcript_22623/m.53414 type:complete len:95 (-) Transcript_22623:1301-1585(-)
MPRPTFRSLDGLTRSSSVSPNSSPSDAGLSRGPFIDGNPSPPTCVGSGGWFGVTEIFDLAFADDLGVFINETLLIEDTTDGFLECNIDRAPDLD